MESFDSLHNLINAVIIKNGNNGITGQNLNSVFTEIVDTINNLKIGKEVFYEKKYALADGLASNNYYYALPDEANGFEDDVLLTEKTLVRAYIPEFTIADILQVVATGTPLNVDYGSLMTAVHRHLPIFVKEFPDYPGINSCSYFYEDYLYLRITTLNEIITIDIGYEGQIQKNNISVLTLGGNGVIATTPSGDPMHYMFEAAGATWNKDTQLWALDEIDDLTTNEVRLMYSKWNKALFPFAYNDKDKIRTIFPFVGYSSNGATNVLCNPNIEIIPPATGNNVISGSVVSWFYNAQNLRKIKVVLDNNDFNSANFAYCYKLEEVRIERLKKSVSFKDSPLLSNESILYMFEKSNAAVDPIAITLHPQAYERAMADPAIIAATEAYPDIELGTTE